MYSVFRLHRTAGDWVSGSISLLLAWGIANPNGPTVSCIGFRETGARGEIEVFYRWMHFLGGEDYCLGYLRSDGERAELAEILTNAFSLEPGDGLQRFPLVSTVPSVLQTRLHPDLVPLARQAFSQSAALRSADWGHEWHLLRKHGSNVFDRAGEETRAALEALKLDPEYDSPEGRQAIDLGFARHQHIPSFSNWTPDDFENRPLEPGDIEAWWETVTRDDFWIPVAYQIAHMWVGASKQAAWRSSPLSRRCAISSATVPTRGGRIP